MTTNKNGKPRKQKALSKAYGQVEANQVRIIARPYRKPPTLFYVWAGGVIVPKCDVWDKTLPTRLIAKGYSVRKENNATFIFEKTVARKDSQ